MGATLKDVAALANVHPSTVSRVLRNVENLKISEDTKERIFKAIKELNYQPDQTARSLRLKKSFTIGLIIPNVASPYFIGIARSLDAECTKEGYTLIISDTNENQEKEIKAVYDLYSRGVDGLVIAPVQDSDEHIKDLIDKKFPFVLIDRYFEKYDTNAVICNDKESAYNAVKHLIDLGHKRIGFISGRPNLYPVVERLEGYKNVLEENNLEFNQDLIFSSSPTLDDAYEASIKLMELPVPPTAILITGTIITFGVLKAIIEKKKTVPKDLSIIAFTDTILASYFMSPVSTVSHKVDEIGTKAFEILFEHMKSDDLPYSKVVIDTNFVDRNSTAKANI
ncbi:MAG: LacI family transcriptional regulator [Chlorobi bacterium]|nr:LacI family transcriptional regulator [Chlorobiota bacterium]